MGKQRRDGMITKNQARWRDSDKTQRDSVVAKLWREGVIGTSFGGAS